MRFHSPLIRKAHLKDYNKDILYAFLILVVSALTIYLLPRFFTIFLLLSLILTFYYSKKDYFWLALIFIIENYPGSLFSRYTSDIEHTFSVLPVSFAGTLYFWMLFILVGLIKVINKRHYYNQILRNYLFVLLIYFIFLVLIFGLYKTTAVVRTLLPWTFLLIMPSLLKNDLDYVRFFKIIFSFVFFVIISQLLQIIFNITLAKILGGSDISLSTVELTSADRPVDGIFISFLSMFGSLYYLIFKKKYFNRTYLFTILILSFFSIFLTATRSWLIASLFIVFNSLLLINRKSQVFLRIILPILLIIPLVFFVPRLNRQIKLAMKRYQTLELLFKGDQTAGGTLSRLDVRSPKVMSKFKESPIIGWGYGIEANEYNDLHVANQNMLMHTGILGYSLWVILWIIFIVKMLLLNSYISSKNPYKDIPVLLIFVFIGIIIIHSAAQWFDYLLQFLPGFMIIFIFSFSSFITKRAKIEERILKSL